MNRNVLALVCTLFILIGCGTEFDRKVVDAKYLLGIGDYKKLEFAVKAFSEGVDECVLDVRDRGLKWEESRNCAALGVLSKAYIDAGGWTADEPSYIKAQAYNALSSAWAAKALSCCGGYQSLW